MILHFYNLFQSPSNQIDSNVEASPANLCSENIDNNSKKLPTSNQYDISAHNETKQFINSQHGLNYTLVHHPIENNLPTRTRITSNSIFQNQTHFRPVYNSQHYEPIPIFTGNDENRGEVLSSSPKRKITTGIQEKRSSKLHDTSCQTDFPYVIEASSIKSSQPFSIETRSLRSEIDNVLQRKQALDSRFQNLLDQQEVARKSKLTDASNSMNKPSFKNICLLNQLDSGQINFNDDAIMRPAVRESYLAKVREDSPDFPSLGMQSSENGNQILELQNVETDIPGLGDSGLSNEINSINVTIQELIKENQQLHGYLQNLTSESIAKVDYDKELLTKKVQQLMKENETLRDEIESKKPVNDNSELTKIKSNQQKNMNKTISNNQSSSTVPIVSPKNLSNQFDDTGFHEDNKINDNEPNNFYQFNHLNIKIDDLTRKNEYLQLQLENEKLESQERLSSLERKFQALLSEKEKQNRPSFDETKIESKNNQASSLNIDDNLYYNSQELPSTSSINQQYMNNEFILPKIDDNQDQVPVKSQNDVTNDLIVSLINQNKEFVKDLESRIDHSLCKALINELNEKCDATTKKLSDIENVQRISEKRQTSLSENRPSITEDDSLQLSRQSGKGKQLLQLKNSSFTQTNKSYLKKFSKRDDSHLSRDAKLKCIYNEDESISSKSVGISTDDDISSDIDNGDNLSKGSTELRHFINESEHEKMRLHKKIEDLMKENRCLVVKLEEMVEISRAFTLQVQSTQEELQSTRNDLQSITNHRDELQKRVK